MLKAAPHDHRLRWAILISFTDSGLGILKRLKFDNNTIHTASELLRFEHTELTGLTDPEMRRFMHEAGAENMPLIFEFRRVKDPDTDYSDAEEQYRSIIRRGECTSIKELAVDGNELMTCGVPAGKEVGDALNRLLEAVLEDPALNQKDILLERTRNEQK